MKALETRKTVSLVSVFKLKEEIRRRKIIPVGVAFALLTFILTNYGMAWADESWRDVNTYGAVGDGVTMNTRAIQSAINTCPAGGVVWLHNGTFLSGTIMLHDNMTLCIDSTAVLLGSGLTNDYSWLNANASNTQQPLCDTALIYAQNCTNVTINGGGTVNGNGRTNFPPDYAGLRPIAILTSLCTNVLIQNINVVDSAQWTVVNLEADYLTISNVTINDDGLLPNRDGFDVIDCWHVVIENCTIDSGDDSICLKSGSPRGVQDFIARNCTITKSGANGLKLGTASSGTFSNILFQDCTIMNTHSAAMNVESVDGATITDVTFENINFSGCQNAIFMILGTRDPGVEPGTINGVQFRNITGSDLIDNRGCPISGDRTNGVTYYLQNILFDNVNIAFAGYLLDVPAPPPEYAGQYPENIMWGDLPAYGYYIRHAFNVTFTNCSTSVVGPDARPWLAATDDVASLKVIPPPPALNVVPNAGALVLQWDGSFLLQSATNLNGIYTSVAGATSPYTNNLPNSRERFFRLIQ